MYSANNPVIFTDKTGKATKTEWLISIKHPIAAIKVKNNSEIASIETQRRFPKGGHNDKADAFRHAYWNALNTRDVGKIIAKKFADAHEEFDDNPNAEKEMDLNNNEKGREISEANPDLNDDEMADEVMEASNNNELQNTPNSNPKKTDLNYYKTIDNNYDGKEEKNKVKTGIIK